jgi:hypothetical protein
VPKVGGASDLAIKIPTPDTEERYLRSVNHTVDAFRGELERLRVNGGETTTLANIDLDTGYAVALGDYPLTDQTYARLLERLTSKPERTIPAALKQDVLAFYAQAATSSERLTARLNSLKGMKTADTVELQRTAPRK